MTLKVHEDGSPAAGVTGSKIAASVAYALRESEMRSAPSYDWIVLIDPWHFATFMEFYGETRKSLGYEIGWDGRIDCVKFMGATLVCTLGMKEPFEIVRRQQ